MCVLYIYILNEGGLPKIYSILSFLVQYLIFQSFFISNWCSGSQP